jgi:hypothetical protein
MTTQDLVPNSVPSIEDRWHESPVEPRRVWLMLFSRIILILAFQVVFAVGFWVSGEADPWRRAADWWLLTVVLAEAFNLYLLRRASASEGLKLRDIYGLSRGTWKPDLGWALGALVVAGPLGLFPAMLLTSLLWSDPEASSALLFRPLPMWAVWPLVFIFPIIHALTELPTYYGYAMPRLRVLGLAASSALFMSAGVFALQHLFMPLLPDWRYLLWRALAFLPLTLWLGWVIQKRPTTLPYLMGAHALLDLSLPLLLLQASM